MWWYINVSRLKGLPTLSHKHPKHFTSNITGLLHGVAHTYNPSIQEGEA